MPPYSPYSKHETSCQCPGGDTAWSASCRHHGRASIPRYSGPPPSDMTEACRPAWPWLYCPSRPLARSPVGTSAAMLRQAIYVSGPLVALSVALSGSAPGTLTARPATSGPLTPLPVSVAIGRRRAPIHRWPAGRVGHHSHTICLTPLAAFSVALGRRWRPVDRPAVGGVGDQGATVGLSPPGTPPDSATPSLSRPLAPSAPGTPAARRPHRAPRHRRRRRRQHRPRTRAAGPSCWPWR